MGTNNAVSDVVQSSDGEGHDETSSGTPELQPSDVDAVSECDIVHSIPDVVEAEFVPTPELKELAIKWGADIGVSGKLVSNIITMSRKDYLKHIKAATQESLLDDPLLYVLFRSEEQGEANFFMWLERFPRKQDA